MKCSPSFNTTLNESCNASCFTPRNVINVAGLTCGKCGGKAPEFPAKLHSCDLFHLWDILSNVQVDLYFDPKDFALGRTNDVSSFQDHLEDITHLGALVIGVSPDAVEPHSRFGQHDRLTYFPAPDPDSTIARKRDVTRPAGVPIQRASMSSTAEESSGAS